MRYSLMLLERGFSFMRGDDLAGRVYGRLTVLPFTKKDQRYSAYWLCQCSCGKKKFIRVDHLNSGRVKSCGCLNREETVRRNKENIIHGMSGTPTYKTWDSMKRRCLNPKDKDFANYGGRGIMVCQRWITSFACFFEDMGVKPKNMTLDRIDNSRGYSKDNCRWADCKTQGRNKRTNNLQTYNGETLPIIEWAERFNMSDELLRDRLRNGWTMERALFEPLRERAVSNG